MLTAVRHYTEMAHQAHREVFTQEIGRALNHLSLALIYPKANGVSDLEIAKRHIANAEKALREIEG